MIRLGALACALLLLTSSAVHAQQRLEDVFVDGRDAYEHGDRATAIQRWESLVAAGVDDADLHFDLGTAYGEEGDYPRAVLAFERALRVDPSDAGAARGLDEARVVLAQREANREGEAEFATDAHLAGALFRPLREDVLAIAVLGFELVALFGLLLWWVRRERLGALVVGVVALALMATSALGLATKRGLFDPGPRAIVLETTPLRSGPAPDAAEDGGEAHGGGAAFILERERVGSAPAVLLELADGTQGWLPATAVGEI